MTSRAVLKALPLIALAVVLGAFAITSEIVQAASPEENPVVVPLDITAELALLDTGEISSSGWNRAECLTALDCDVLGAGAKCAWPWEHPPYGCTCQYDGGELGCYPRF